VRRFIRHYQCDTKEYPAQWRFLGGVVLEG